MKLSNDQLSKLKSLDVAMMKNYPYSPNSHHYLQFGFFNGDKILFIGQNLGLSQENVPREASQKLFEDYTNLVDDYEEYMRKYQEVLYLDTCPMGTFIKDVYEDNWSDISFTNYFKNPFIDHKVDQQNYGYFDYYLERQISIIRPKLIVTLGKVPANFMERERTKGVGDRTPHLSFQHYSYLLRSGRYKSEVQSYKTQLSWMLKKRHR